MKPKYIKTYMDIAERWATESSAIKLKVGAVIVTGDAMVAGYNGTPEGWDNTCEYKVYCTDKEKESYTTEFITNTWPYVDNIGRYYLKTKDETLHAEMNALSKLAKSTLSGVHGILFCTHNPCINCAKAIYQAGIRTVYYKHNYRLDDGVTFLERAGVIVARV